MRQTYIYYSPNSLDAKHVCNRVFTRADSLDESAAALGVCCVLGFAMLLNVLSSNRRIVEGASPAAWRCALATRMDPHRQLASSVTGNLMFECCMRSGTEPARTDVLLPTETKESTSPNEAPNRNSATRLFLSQLSVFFCAQRMVLPV